MNKKDDENCLEATRYVKRGSMLYLRSALPLNDSEGWPELWKKKFGSLEGFPWKEVFGREPTLEDLIEAGIKECPTCGKGLRHE